MITDSQKVDYLFKKLGFGVTKTDTSTVKSPSNESIGSPLLIRGDKIWAQSSLIPTTKPATSDGVVTLESVQCVVDSTASTSRTWKSNKTDWIPPEFGSTYQVKVYLATTGATDPTTGIQLFADGTGNNDEWYFDYASGVLHFIGTNLPSVSFSGKSIFVIGARYTGNVGIDDLTNIIVGNLKLEDNTFSSLDGDIIISPASNIVDVAGASITNLADPENGSDAATKNYVDSELANFNDDRLVSGNTIVQAFSSNVTISPDGTLVSYFTPNLAVISNIEIQNSSITSLGTDLSITGTSGFIIPQGLESERPVSPSAGHLRFNTDTDTIEYFNGQSWISVTSIVKSQIITGNDVDDTFELDYITDTNGIIVSINGTVQQPVTAYNVVNNNGLCSLELAETPNSTDVIEVRYIASSVVPSFNSLLVNPANTQVGGSAVEIDSFSANTYRSAKYTISSSGSTDFQLTDILVVHNGTDSFISISNSVNTGSNVVTFTTSLASNTVKLMASSLDPSSTIKIQKTYFLS